MRLRRISESIMGSREYKVPTNAMTMMADFYLLDLLEHGARNTTSERDDVIAFELRSVSSVLLPALRQHLLGKAGFSIACEMRHLYDTAKLNDAIAEDAVPDLSQAPEPRRKRRRRPMPDDSSGPMDGYNEWDDEEEEDDDYDDEREREDDSEVHPTPADVSDTDRWLRQHISDQAADILRLAIRTGNYPNYEAVQPYLEEYAKAGLLAFSNLFLWSENYGGDPWRQACRSWLDLKNNGQRMYIDRIYQLQHNNGNLLDKNPEYKGKWLNQLLDAKYVANDPEALVGLASPFIKTLTGFVLRSRYGRSHDHMAGKQDEQRKANKILELAMQNFHQSSPHATLEPTQNGFVLWDVIKADLPEGWPRKPPANYLAATQEGDYIKVAVAMDAPTPIPDRRSIFPLSGPINYQKEIPIRSEIGVFNPQTFSNELNTVISQMIWHLMNARWR